MNAISGAQLDAYMQINAVMNILKKIKASIKNHGINRIKKIFSLTKKIQNKTKQTLIITI